MRPLVALNLAPKAALLGLLLFAVLAPDLPQFAGKAMGTRLVTFGLPVLAVPALRWVRRRRRGGPSGRPYPHLIDLLVVLPFLMDTAGNALDLYDGVAWFDDVMHVATWVPWVTAFGLALHRARPPLPRWAHVGLVVGFGAATHVLWEIGEYLTFLRDSPEAATAYRDTVGDLAASLTGTLLGAALVATVLWAPGRASAAPLDPHAA